jgi:rhodanese-related sulfurtransferase
MRKVLFILLLTTACAKESRNDSTAIKSLSAAEFSNRLTDQAVLLDVRTPQEFEGGYIPGAINLDFKAADFEARLDSLDRSRDYMLYCAKGVRSDKTADKMRELGFTSVSTLEGGLDAWVAQGLPVQAN